MAGTGVGLQPRTTKGEHNDNTLRENPIARAYAELPAHRYRLKGPTFTGNEDVEQFTQEFSDVADVTQWPPKIALIQLRRALTEQADLYRPGASVAGVFAALRACFGISAVDAKARIQRLRHDPHTTL